MRFAHDTHNFGQPQAGLAPKWGPAARAQSQSTPGASALAAPHQQSFACTPRARVWANLLGVLEVAIVLGGCGGFVAGMYLLATNPLPGVVVVLASMAMLLSSVAKLSEAQETRHECDAGQGRFSRGRADTAGR